jgi:hypothetical protein
MRFLPTGKLPGRTWADELPGLRTRRLLRRPSQMRRWLDCMRDCSATQTLVLCALQHHSHTRLLCCSLRGHSTRSRAAIQVKCASIALQAKRARWWARAAAMHVHLVMQALSMIRQGKPRAPSVLLARSRPTKAQRGVSLVVGAHTAHPAPRRRFFALAAPTQAPPILRALTSAHPQS